MLRAIFASFIAGSLAAATLEGTRRCAHKCLLALCRRVYLAGRQARYKLGGGHPEARGTQNAPSQLTNYRFLKIDKLVFGSSASANFREA